MRRSRLCLFITLCALLFLYFPIVVLVINSFNVSRFGDVWQGFSLKWYVLLFDEKPLWIAVWNSLLVAGASTLFSTLLGSCAAFALYRYKTPLQKIHYGLIYAPLILPDMLMGISLLLYFFVLNIPLGLFSIIVAHTTFCLSYVTMVVLSKLQNFDYSIVEAAQDLGADTKTVLWRIILPIMKPGLYAAALLAFTLSIDDFVITFFVAGEGVSTLPLYIYGMMKYGATPIINALSTIILVLTFLTMGLMRKISKEASL